LSNVKELQACGMTGWQRTGCCESVCNVVLLVMCCGFLGKKPGF